MNSPLNTGFVSVDLTGAKSMSAEMMAGIGELSSMQEDGSLPTTLDAGVVGQRPAIAREGCWAGGVIGQYLRQQCPCRSPCLLRRILTCVLQSVCEDGNEATIVRRLTREVGISLRTNKTACAGSAPRSTWTQPPTAPSSVRAHRPTRLAPRSELGTSSTMPHTFLSAKKSSPVKLLVVQQHGRGRCISGRK
jgi:hypothetical protein